MYFELFLIMIHKLKKNLLPLKTTVFVKAPLIVNNTDTILILLSSFALLLMLRRKVVKPVKIGKKSAQFQRPIVQ